MNPRGRWRRRRNLRRVPTTSDQPDRGGARKRSISASHTVRDPVFGAIFSENRAVRPPTCSKKWLTKKKNRQQQTKSGRSRARPGPCFGQPNVRYQSQNLSKVVLKTSCGSLLRTRLKGTSGFSSVVGTLLKLRLRRKKRYNIFLL